MKYKHEPDVVEFIRHTCRAGEQQHLRVWGDQERRLVCHGAALRAPRPGTVLAGTRDKVQNNHKVR